MDKVSYAIGASMAQTLVDSGVQKVDFESFLDGFKAILLHRQLKVSVEDGNKILNTFFERIQKEKDDAERKERAENKKLSEDFLQKNLKSDDIKVTESGLQYRIINQGDGEHPTAHSHVKCHYEGKLMDGTIFDSSYDRGEPTTFGLDQVIPGWTEGLQLMPVGSTYEFFISPELGYGEVGYPGHIPGNIVLIFKVELLSIED